MPSVITDPQAYIAEIVKRRKALSPFMQGLTGNTDAPPTSGWEPSVDGVADTLKSLIPQSMRPPVDPNSIDAYPDPRAEALRNQGPRTLDPALAASQGYRIPGYTPPTPGGIGSDAVASNVNVPPEDIPFPQPRPSDLGAVSQSPDTTGAVAPPDKSHDYFSFFGKPQATDAMTAFGAAMLKGSNFREGLANAATAVNDVSKQYRPLSEQEIARMRQLAEIQRVLKGNSYSKGDVGYAPGIGYVPTRYNQNTGVTEYQIGDTFTSKAPPGFQQRTDYGAATNSKLDLQAYDKDYQNYEAGKANERQFADMVQLAPTINAGGDAWSKVQRKIGATLGVDFGGDLGDQQYFEKLSNSAQLEGAQSQKGLGQFTEMERKIVADSLPSMGTKESTIIQVGTRLALQQEIKTKIVENWDSMSDQQKQEYGSYRTYKQRMLKDFYDNYEANYQRKLRELAPGTAAKSSSGSSSGKPSLDDIFK